MRLGILIYSLAGGGAERVVSYLTSYCLNHDIEVHLIMMNTIIKYDLPENLNIHYIEKSRYNEKSIYKVCKIPLLAYRYAQLVKKLNLTHSLSFLTRPNFINLLASKLTTYNFKIITNERCFPSLQYGYKDFSSSFNKRMIKTLYKKSDLVISNSYGNATDLVNNFEVPANKMKVIHNPIDIDKINKIEPEKSFFDPKYFNIISIGRLTRGKNNEMLINAIHQLQNPLLRLYIFGIGDYEDQLKLLKDKLNIKKQVFLMGFTNNPHQYLKSADLFMFGSSHEGFPNALLEAMACGLPILSTNCQSGPSEIMELETVKDDIMITDYGILVPIKNTDLMAKGVRYFVGNKTYLEKCKSNNLNRVKDFEKETILNNYIDLINTTNVLLDIKLT